MRWVALCFSILAMIFLTFAMAMSYGSIPQPCIDLAARDRKPLPTTERQAKRAEAEVRFKAFFGDKLARTCRDAIDAEKRR